MTDYLVSMNFSADSNVCKAGAGNSPLRVRENECYAALLKGMQRGPLSMQYFATLSFCSKYVPVEVHIQSRIASDACETSRSFSAVDLRAWFTTLRNPVYSILYPVRTAFCHG